MRITVVGLGKLGLPLAVQYAKKGHEVIGADINRALVDLVNSGTEPFPGEYLLQEFLTEVVSQGGLTAVTDTSQAVSESDVVVVAVPLFTDEEATPDFSAMDAAATAIGKGLTPGTLICFETTLPIGTTRMRLTPILEKQSGLKAGTEFFVVFSPERVLTGRVFADLRKYPKLVGGIDNASTERGLDFYRSVLDFDERPDLDRPNGVWDMGSAEAAEFAKLAETTYRDVNIGLANQFAKHADKIGVNVYKVIEACNSQPFSHIHQPGIAVGGHCIPVYPRLYLWNNPEASIVREARNANASMPTYSVELLEQALGDLSGKRVLILGVSYRSGVKASAFSGVFPLTDSLQARGAEVYVHDPLYSPAEIQELGLRPINDAITYHAGILHTPHADFESLASGVLQHVDMMLDGRNAWPEAGGLKVVVLGSGVNRA